MKQVMEQYAAVMIALPIAIVILFFFAGAENKPAQIAQCFFSERGYTQYQIQTGRAFDQYRSKRDPKVETQNTYLLKAGKAVQLENLFLGISGGASTVKLTLEGCWKENGEMIVLQEAENGVFSIANPGIYWVQIKAEEADGSSRSVLSKVFVNER